MTHDDSPRKRRPTGDEGAACTKWIIDEVKRRRAGLDWTAERLAEEMTAAGVPWTRDIVVNLENGRRKTLAVHELLALAWVLDVASPVDLIAPPGYAGTEPFPVTPVTTATPEQVRAWFTGKPLRRWIGTMASLKETVRQSLLEIDRRYPQADGGEAIEDLIARTLAPLDSMPLPETWGPRAEPPPGGACDGPR